MIIHHRLTLPLLQVAVMSEHRIFFHHLFEGLFIIIYANGYHRPVFLSRQFFRRKKNCSRPTWKNDAVVVDDCIQLVAAAFAALKIVNLKNVTQTVDLSSGSNFMGTIAVERNNAHEIIFFT